MLRVTARLADAIRGIPDHAPGALGDTQRAGYDVVRGWARVDADTGANFFQRDAQGRHQFVVKAHENAFYSEAINALIG